jgi:DNA-binding NarL/FixJ family response regulator
MIRVVLADDQALVRAGFRVLLDAQPDLEVVGEAADGAEAVALAVEHVPDVILMDIRMPNVDGLEATRRISAQENLAAVHILILTTFEEDEYVFEAIRHGASGFLVKDTEPVELLHAVRVVAGGDALLSPSVTRRLIGEFASRAKKVRGGGAGRRGPDERRDRRAPGGQPGHGQDPRQPGDDQAERAGPCAGGGAGLRVRPGPSRMVGVVMESGRKPWSS